MKAYLALCGLMNETVLDRVACRTRPVEFNEIPAEQAEKNKLLYYVLASSCTGRAQCYVRAAEGQNGLEAWRLLNQRYHRQNAESTFELLRALMNFSCGTEISKVEDKLAEFDSLVQEYEERATEIISDEVVRGILMHAVPEPLKSHLRVCASSFVSSHDVRRAISEFVRTESKESFKEMFDNSDPMEVDTVRWDKGKGKGKSKGKGKDDKGKGKGKFRNDAQGAGQRGRAEDRDTCRWCGRRGHWQRDCRQKQNMRGAGKGSGDRGREQQRSHVNQIATTTQRDLKQPET